MFLRRGGNKHPDPVDWRSGEVWEGKGVTGANRVALRSPRALWDRNMYVPARGDARFRRFKLRHQPWALRELTQGADAWVPLILRPP